MAMPKARHTLRYLHARARLCITTTTERSVGRVFDLVGCAMVVCVAQGPWRSNSSVQRGSVQFLSICAGDPRNVECAHNPSTYNYTQVLPAIPVQPISYSDAAPILRGLNGSLPSSSWQGALNFTYHTGPGPVVVRLALNIKFNVCLTSLCDRCVH
jgi:hypothetical protein